MNCPDCKREIDENANYCGFCGAKIEKPEIAEKPDYDIFFDNLNKIREERKLREEQASPWGKPPAASANVFSDKRATGAFALSILSVMFCFISIANVLTSVVSIILGISGLILGIAALKEKRPLALAAVLISVTGLLFGLVFFIFFVRILAQVMEETIDGRVFGEFFKYNSLRLIGFYRRT